MKEVVICVKIVDIQNVDNMEENKFKFYCSRCGSTEIQMQAWVYPNTEDRDFRDFVASKIHQCWCENCQENRDVIIKDNRINNDAS